MNAPEPAVVGAIIAEHHINTVAFSNKNTLAIYTTFDAARGLRCEHCAEFAAHHLEDVGNLCPKCLTDAIDVLAAQTAFQTAFRRHVGECRTQVVSARGYGRLHWITPHQFELPQTLEGEA